MVVMSLGVTSSRVIWCCDMCDCYLYCHFLFERRAENAINFSNLVASVCIGTMTLREAMMRHLLGTSVDGLHFGVYWSNERLGNLGSFVWNSHNSMILVVCWVQFLETPNWSLHRVSGCVAYLLTCACVLERGSIWHFFLKRWWTL